MNWGEEEEVEEDATQRFASNLVPRKSPTKQEEELLASKIEARRLLMKLNGALDDLRLHMVSEDEDEYLDDDDDEEEEEKFGERKYASNSNNNRTKNRTNNNNGRRLGGRNSNSSRLLLKQQQQNNNTPQKKQNEKNKSPLHNRPKWNDRYQPTDSPLDYEAPRFKKGFHPASPGKTLKSGTMNNIVNNKKRKKKKNTKKPTWDSRIIATRSALDDVPTRPRSNLMKKRVVSLKDLEHLASLAPTASLKELLDVGKNAVNLQQEHKIRRNNNKKKKTNNYNNRMMMDEEDEEDHFDFYEEEEDFEGEEVDDNYHNNYDDDDFKEEELDDEEEEEDDTYEEDEEDFFDDNKNNNNKSLASVGGGNINSLLKKYANEKQNRSRQIRYTNKSINGSNGGRKYKTNNNRKKLKKIPTRKKKNNKGIIISKKKKKIAAIKASNKQRLKRLSKVRKKKKKHGPKSNQNSKSRKKNNTKKSLHSSNRSSQQHIRWHQGDVLDNPGIPRSPGGILKNQQNTNSAPVLGGIRSRKRPQSAPGMRRSYSSSNTADDDDTNSYYYGVSSSRRRGKNMTKNYGKDDNGLLKWNWNGPRDAADIRKILDPSSPASPSHWSNMVNVSNINMRPLHLPKKREYPAPKIPITKFRPAPVSSGHPTTRTERIQNYRLEHFPEYARLGEGQMCVTIAHCCNCHLHQKTTRHDEAKYKNYAMRLAAGIRMAMPLVKVIVKPGLIGGFEVQICRQEAQKLKKTLLHSKLVTHTWPDIPLLIERIKKFTPKHELVVNITANVDNDQIFSEMIAKVVDESGEIVCDPEFIVPLRSLERNVARGTVSLLVPSGSYTLVVEGATRDEEDGKIIPHTNDADDKFLPIKEHIDTTEEVRTVIDRVLTLKRHLIVNVTRAQRSQSCSGAQVIVKDQFTKDVKTGICNNDGVITFMLGPVPKKHLNGAWPTDGFTNNLIITANEIGGNLKSKSVSCKSPDIKSTEGSLIEIDVGGTPIYDDDFQ